MAISLSIPTPHQYAYGYCFDHEEVAYRIDLSDKNFFFKEIVDYDVIAIAETSLPRHSFYRESVRLSLICHGFVLNLSGESSFFYIALGPLVENRDLILYFNLNLKRTPLSDQTFWAKIKNIHRQDLTVLEHKYAFAYREIL